MMMKHLPILLIYLENNYVGGPATDTLIYLQEAIVTMHV